MNGRGLLLLLCVGPLAGCLEAVGPPTEHGRGAFDELGGKWSPSGKNTHEVRSGEMCARLTAGNSYSAIRTGIDAPVDVRLENCGTLPLELAPAGRCGRQYVAVELSLQGFVWQLDGTGRARAAGEPCEGAPFPPRVLLQHEAFTETWTWAGYVAADTCGGGGPRSGTVTAAAGGWHIEAFVEPRGLGRLHAGTPLEIMGYQYERHYRSAIWFWPEGDGSGRTVLEGISLGDLPQGRTVLESQAAWADLCAKFADGAPTNPLGWPYLDFQRERVEVEVERPDAAACRDGPPTAGRTDVASLSEPGTFVCPWVHVRAVARPLLEPRSEF